MMLAPPNMALARIIAAASRTSNSTASVTSNLLAANHASNYSQQTRHGSAGLINRVLAGSNHKSPSLVARLSTSAAASSDEPTAATSGGQEVAVQSGDGEGRKSRWKSLLPRRFQRGRRNDLWRNESRDMAPPSRFFGELSPPNLGNALLEATNNINRLFDALSPSQLIGTRIKERDDSYKLRFEVPGLSKEDIKITVDDGVLNIRGEHKEEQRTNQSDDDESDDEFYSSSRSYYNSSMVLPEDVKEDGIRAELKNGVLTVIVPKDEKKAKEVKHIEIQ